MKTWPLISYLKTNLYASIVVFYFIIFFFFTIVWSIIFTIIGSDVARQGETFADCYTHAMAGTLDQTFAYFLSPLSLKRG